MKRSLLWLLVVVISISMISVFSLAGCKKEAVEEEAAIEEAPEEEELIIGYIAGILDPFMVKIQDGAEAKAEELGGVIVETQIPEVWSVDVQAPMFTAYANRGDIDLIMGVPVDKEALIPVLKDVYEKGIPIITCDTTIGDGDYTEGSDSFALSAVNTDNIAAGEKAGHALAEMIGEKGEVYLQMFKVGVSTSDERAQGFRNAIAEYPDIEIVAENSCDDDEDLAQTQTAAALKANPDIVGVFGNNLFACLGSAIAVKNAGLSGVVSVVGFDVTPQVAEMLEEGTMQGAVCQKPFEIGSTALELGVEYLRFGEEPDKLVKIGSEILTTENILDPESQELIYK
jgi:ribose transport system substrate-binding protein